MDRDNWNIKDEADHSAIFGSSIFSDDDELDLVLDDDMPEEVEKAVKKESAGSKAAGKSAGKAAGIDDDDIDFNPDKMDDFFDEMDDADIDLDSVSSLSEDMADIENEVERLNRGESMEQMLEQVGRVAKLP